MFHVFVEIWNWCWSAGVPGNLAASIIWVPFALLGALVWTHIKVVKPMRKRHEEQRIHEAKIEESQQILHDHLGTGHIVKEALENSTPADRLL